MNFLNMKKKTKHSDKLKYLLTKINHKIFMKLAVTEIIGRSKSLINRRIDFLIIGFCINPANILKTHVMIIQIRRKTYYMSVETSTVILLIS
jgi:hypothetical protein